MNDRLLGHMADADLIKSIWIEQAEIGDDQFRIEMADGWLGVVASRRGSSKPEGSHTRKVEPLRES